MVRQRRRDLEGSRRHRHRPDRPVLPQSSSGTRSQWLSDIGVTTPGSCVINGSYNGTTIEENEGTNAVYTTADPSYKDVFGIFSGGSDVCQVCTKKCPDDVGSLVLEDIGGKAPLTSTHTINVTGLTAFPSKYIRGLYFVTLNAGTASAPKVPTTPIDYTEFLGQGNTSGWICGTTAAAHPTTCVVQFAGLGPHVRACVSTRMCVARTDRRSSGLPRRRRPGCPPIRHAASAHKGG
jgi:hypothetical protein